MFWNSPNRIPSGHGFEPTTYPRSFQELLCLSGLVVSHSSRNFRIQQKTYLPPWVALKLLTGQSPNHDLDRRTLWRSGVDMPILDIIQRSRVYRNMGCVEDPYSDTPGLCLSTVAGPKVRNRLLHIGFLIFRVFWIYPQAFSFRPSLADAN